MYTLTLIRHGKTEGNMRAEYVGVTDQPLCEQGIAELMQYKQASKYPYGEHVFISPMQRCRQTKDLLYPSIPYTVIPELKECNFGAFEGKNYKELEHDMEYQRWLDEENQQGFPLGDHIETYKTQCRQGFERAILEIFRYNIKNSVFIIHGGSIMSILEAYTTGQSHFFDWHTGNGHGYVLQIDPKQWFSTKKIAKVSPL